MTVAEVPVDEPQFHSYFCQPVYYCVILDSRQLQTDLDIIRLAVKKCVCM